MKTALQRVPFRHIILAQLKILVPVDQTLQCLMPNAVLAIYFSFPERVEKQQTRKSYVLSGSCLVQATRLGGGGGQGVSLGSLFRFLAWNWVSWPYGADSS